MSKLKISSNLFLEVNELQRFNKFIEEDGWKRAMKAITKNFGIVENDSNNYFKVTAKTGSNSVIIINAGLAFDSNMDAIVMESDLELTIANTGQNRWVILSRGITNNEKGTVNINTDGSLSGIDTEFTKVLRGQPNFPVKVKFNSTKNTEEYEVVSVSSDTSALVSGYSFVSENRIKYSVIGTFTPGFQPNDENKLIYEYDHYKISIIDSEDRPSISEDEFILSMISFDESGSMSVSDERINHMFNNPYIQSYYSDNFTNPIVSLLSVGVIGGYATNSSVGEFEMIIEHGYSVTEFEMITDSTRNIFKITEGNSNYLGTGDIPDGLFKGWILLNRSNMKYALISDNTNKSLLIKNFDSSIIKSSGNDFVIVPNCNEIEYEIKVSNNVDRSNIPFYFRNSISNVYSRTKIYIYYTKINPEKFENKVKITIKYRLIDNSGKKYPFNGLSISQFENIKSKMETLAESSFTIDLSTVEPNTKQRNYS